MIEKPGYEVSLELLAEYGFNEKDVADGIRAMGGRIKKLESDIRILKEVKK